MSNELQFPKFKLQFPPDMTDEQKKAIVDLYRQTHMSPKHKKRLAKQLKKAEKERDESRKKVLGH